MSKLKVKVFLFCFKIIFIVTIAQISCESFFIIHSFAENENIYTEQNTKFSVIIPKIITLDGQTKQGRYQVAVKGNLSEKQKLSVTPNKKITLCEQNAFVDAKDNVVADISQSKTTWSQNEMDKEEYKGEGIATGVISAGGITAGYWAGKLSFDIKLINEETNDETTNGEITDDETEFKNIVYIRDTGVDFNTAIKQLVDESATCETQDITITGIELTNVAPEEGVKTIDISDKTKSNHELIGYLDETKIKLYTEADTVMLPEDSSFMFADLWALERLSLDKYDASGVTNMMCMFANCGYTNMTILDLGDNFDTSKVTDMRFMFVECGHEKMSELKLGNNFDTSNVINMEWMFSYCGYVAMTNLDLGDNFDTSKVTNMAGMFYCCGYEKMTNLDLKSNFKITNLQEAVYIFHNTGTDMINISAPETVAEYFNAMSIYDGKRIINSKIYN